MLKELSAVVLLLSAVAARTPAARKQPMQVLVSWTPNATGGFSLRPSDTPTPGSLLTWWNGFNVANVTEAGNGTTFTQDPHTATVPPLPSTELSSFGVLDHVKHLATSGPYDTHPTRKLVFSTRLVARATIPATLPYNVTDPQDDPRLAASTVNFLDFNTLMIADLWVTNGGIWAMYERLPFGRTADHIYAAFTYVKRLVSRTSGDEHVLQIKYSRAKNEYEWWVDGKMKLKVGKLGRRPKGMRALVDHGGVEEDVTLAAVWPGIGGFSFLDGGDPNAVGPACKVGLLNLNPTAAGSSPEVYKVPSSWQVDSRTNTSAITDAAWRLFGQGTSMTVSKFLVGYE